MWWTTLDDAMINTDAYTKWDTIIASERVNGEHATTIVNTTWEDCKNLTLALSTFMTGD